MQGAKLAITSAVVLALSALSPVYADTPPVTLSTKQVAGIAVQVVVVTLREGVRVEAELARGGIGTSEPLGAIVSRTHAVAALTGTFFDTKTLLPIGDIVQDGELVHFGGCGAGLCLRSGRHGLKARIRPNAGRNRHTDWNPHRTVLGGGMWLVRHGKIALSLKKQGFSPGLQRPTQRVAVGVTTGGQLLLVATAAKASLSQWALALRALGAEDALNFDGGSSAGLYFGGKAIVTPGRKLTNALLVYAPVKKESVPKLTLARRGKRSSPRT